jgi:capsular polysaccharide biosynthesis protein
VTAEITSQFLDENFRQRLALLQILDGASLPKSPAYPNKPLLIGFGVGCFLMMWGGLSAWRSVSARRFAAEGPSISSGDFPSAGPVALSLPPFREHLRRNAWKILAALALLIAVAALSFKLANPNYESIAVIKISPRAGGQANADYIPSLTQSVESRSSLVRIISDYDLYRSEDYRLPLEKIIERMKEHIRIEPLGQNSAVAIRFAYSDRFIAQKVTQELALQMVEASAAGDSPASLSVLDPASLPEPRFPIEPNYRTGLLFGLLLGVTFAGILVLFLRRPIPL